MECWLCAHFMLLEDVKKFSSFTVNFFFCFFAQVYIAIDFEFKIYCLIVNKYLLQHLTNLILDYICGKLYNLIAVQSTTLHFKCKTDR